MEELPVGITCLAEAMLEAFELADQFRQAHAGATLDEEGALLDMIVLARRDHTIRDVLKWARLAAAADDDVARVLLFSVRDEVLDVREADLAAFRDAVADLAGRGVELADWMLCDGKHVRSLAITTGLETWEEVSAGGDWAGDPDRASETA